MSETARNLHTPPLIQTKLYSKTMEIKLQLPDAVYASLMKGNTRVEGSIALVSPREGNFNAYNRNRGKTSRREYRKLPHGRVSMNDESVRLTLNINLDERGIRPSDVIIYESAVASNFVEQITIGE